MSAQPQISLHVTVHIAPEDVPRFIELMTPVYKNVTAEPECTFFQIYQSPENPGTLSWVENWTASVDWLMSVQIKKEYYKEYFEGTEKMFIKPREFRIVNCLGPEWTYMG